MNIRPSHRGGVTIQTGGWFSRRWLEVDRTGYAYAGNVDWQNGLGAAMLRRARQYLERRRT